MWNDSPSERVLVLRTACLFSLAFVFNTIFITLPASAQPRPTSQSETTTKSTEEHGALHTRLAPWFDSLLLKTKAFGWSGAIQVSIDGKLQPVQWEWKRWDDETFFLELKHPDYHVAILRNAAGTALVLPRHQRLYEGYGEVSQQDHLRPLDPFERLVSSGSILHLGNVFMKASDAKAATDLLVYLAGVRPASIESDDFIFLERGKLSLPFNMSKISVEWEEHRVEAQLFGASEIGSPPPLSRGMRWQGSTEYLQRWGELESVTIDRYELEKTIARGLRRAFEVLAPSPALTNPVQRPRKVEHGELEWIDGQRIVRLWGTPQEIGKAHGQLLQKESMRCIDSVLYAFGLVQTVVTGKWFRGELDGAYERLSPHIPERHKVETRALAEAIGVEPALMESLNVFPELFHCSGFAVFGTATVDGKLYHGRVLDYMTAIGLQDAATSFIVTPEGHHAFANIGYAGFTGSVSGMNSQQISLGEMGGKGEGQWDGVPMATLMRRALEECNTLEQVKSLWSESPRTCEYYYVFADGKNRSAVGVAATPQGIQFVGPGEAHPLLGEGIPDALVLSAGNRLETLRRWIQESHGKIDATIGQQLMKRPVAMKSNLHNVLFVPEDGVLYVANADHRSPAADRPYLKIDLKHQLAQIENKRNSQQAAQVPLGEGTLESKVRWSQAPLPAEGALFQACDSIPSWESAAEDRASGVLEGLLWKPAEFAVTIERVGARTLVRFPSAIVSGNPSNDRVALEWYPAQRTSKQSVGDTKLPAVVVVHESGRGMTVGQLIAKGLANQGIHALMIHLPHYGVRRGEWSSSADASIALKQSIADVRRAYDAVRVLPGVEADRISLQGTSLGGFVAATTAGVDDSYHRVVMLLAGGDLVSVVTDGKRDAQSFRKQLEKSGLDASGIQRSLMAVEPLTLAHRINPQKAWLFSGKYDDVVPPRNSKLLADAARLPADHHIELEADHYSGVLLLPTVLRQIAEIVR